MRNVFAGQREFDAGLHEIVADGNFSAERIAPARGRKLLQIVRIALNQNRHVEPGQLQRVGHAFFVAEVRQADEHAVNFARVLAEQFGAFARVVVRLDAAELGIVLAELNGLDAELARRVSRGPPAPR